MLFRSMARKATKAGVEGAALTVHAPLAAMSKGDIVRAAVDLRLDAGATWSCYDPTSDNRPCGLCDSCRLRAKGFDQAGLSDPALA